MKKKIGKRIQMIRLQNNITQEQMADSLCISTSAYCKLEYGETDLTLTRIKRLSEIFNIPLMELTGRLLEGLDNTSETYCTNAGQKNIIMERMMKDFLEQSKEMMDKMMKDISRVESKMDQMESRINELESFHLKK